jgi:hypothetical protein
MELKSGESPDHQWEALERELNMNEVLALVIAFYATRRVPTAQVSSASVAGQSVR